MTAESAIQNAEQKMKKSIESLKTELSKLRTGRAHPSLLEHVHVDYYGTPTPLARVANITIESARMLVVTAWEKNMIAAIDKAIRTSDLGLNPATAGTVIRVPLPQLTEERRRDLVKVMKDEAEKGKVSIRNIRRDTNQEFKDLLKAKKITEDEEKRGEARVQKLTDDMIKQVDQIVAQKERDVMEV